MPKLTRRFKRYNKNKTIKLRGGSSENLQSKENLPQHDERKGVMDIIGNKISDVASSAVTTLGDAGLKIVGLERVNRSAEEVANKKVDDNIEKMGDAASGIVSDVENVVDKTGSAIIDNVNEVLGSDAVKETTQQAAEETADIVKEGAERFNDALNDPEVKAEVEEAIENAGEIGEVVVKAAEKPFNEAVDIASQAVPKATGAAVSGVIKVGTDAMAAIPGVGAIIEFGKMLNDGSKAASAIVEAGSEAVEAGSDMFIETKENVEKGLKELEEKKKMSQQISNRTTKSIKDFENTSLSQSAGGRKTRRRLLKRKVKSKRVRFSI
jgi:ABC-type transporter Mla subunit MlaD